MVFSSMTFLCCALPLALAVYYLLPRRWRNGWLLAFSLLFYAWGEPVYVVLMLFSITFNWGAGLVLGRTASKPLRRGLLAAALAVNLGLLGFFKYAGFLVDCLNGLTGWRIAFIQPALPIGISFYTFQALSYVIDVYRDGVPCQRRWSAVALYISMFPQLIAGPILRYQEVARQIEDRRETLSGFAQGLSRFAAGLAKKVLIANLAAPLADQAFSLAAPPMAGAWLGAAAYALQIYFDFSGYSDMAIGLGRMFGFSYPENFRYPYVSRSVKEFWTRWHISLSGWLRDYLYIPLGGNRVSRGRQALNLLAVFLVTGLWHGAGWTFILWGLYYGVLRAAQALLPRRSGSVPALDWLLTMLLVLVGWVLFRADTLEHALRYLGAMVSGGPGILTRFTPRAGLALAAGCLGATPWPRRLFFRLPCRVQAVAQALLVPSALLLCLLTLAAGTYNPFIYFRF